MKLSLAQKLTKCKYIQNLFLRMPRKKETLTLSVPPGTKEKLEAIAERWKIFWGKSPSPSGLVAAIAQEELEVGQPFALNTAQVKALRQAVKDLIDAGHVAEAQIVLTLLLEKGQLESPLRQSLLQEVSKPTEAWRILVDQQIERQQPFHLIYLNSQKQELEFTVRYAEICFYEKRFYLQIWCDETADVETDLPELPELWHNRCLRLDRIKAIVPMNGEWQGQLDFIEVYLQFRGGLVKAYEPKPDDLSDETIGDMRYVTRRVANPFWLLREISRYWEDCTILAPEGLRKRMQQKIAVMHQLYDDEDQL
jgi:predicted DNA-binding transcriptional regulator YafY